MNKPMPTRSSQKNFLIRFKIFIPLINSFLPHRLAEIKREGKALVGNKLIVPPQAFSTHEVLVSQSQNGSGLSFHKLL